MRSFPTSLCLAPLLAPALLAQGVVSPIHFTSAEAAAFDFTGIGEVSAPVRYLQVHDDLAGTPRMISSLAFRRDAGGPPWPAYGPVTLYADLFLSSAITSSSAPDAMFDGNHGSDKAQVATFKQIVFPATLPGPLVRPFEYPILFTQPFAFGGQRGLCWEIRVHVRQSQNSLYLDYSYGADLNPPPAVYSGGIGCKSTGYSTEVTLVPAGYGNWAASSVNVTYDAFYMPPSATAFLCFGTNAKTWGALNLPFLLPWTESAPSGACNVYSDWLVQVPVNTDAYGNFHVPLGFVVNPGMHGGTIFAQAVVPDSAANVWGVALSNLVQHQVIAPYPTASMGNVYLSGLGQVGAARPLEGYVVRFE